MAELTATIVDEVVAACRAGAQEAGEAFGRELDAEVSLSVGEPGSFQLDGLPKEFDGPGLAVVLSVGSTATLVLLPESSGLVPSRCAEPDPTGRSKLTTLGQELGMVLLPGQFMPEDFNAARVENLAEALRRGEVGDGAAIVPLKLVAEGDTQGTASLVFPAAKPAAVIGADAPMPSTEPAAEPTPPAEPEQQDKPDRQGEPERRAEPHQRPGGRTPLRPVERLPQYTRSLLRIKVPVVVTLAEKRQPVGRIAELGSGSIIQFEKSCEEALEMEVGDRRVATGEAVKVGDKFGLRITSIIMPEERFTTVRTPRNAQRPT